MWPNRFAQNTSYTPDFNVVVADGTLGMHEVTGFWTDDGRAKIKIAADLYPMRLVAIRAKPKKNGEDGRLKNSSQSAVAKALEKAARN